jgi:hypothetical protein
MKSGSVAGWKRILIRMMKNSYSIVIMVKVVLIP